MFNLIKFEIFKRKQLFIILGIIFLFSQLYTIYQFSINSIDNPLAVIFLLSPISYIIFLFSSVTNFSKDITSTDRSMIFMVPQSGFTIISAKFLATLISGLGLLLITSVLAFINIFYRNSVDGMKFISSLQNNPHIISKLILGIATMGSFFALIFLSIIITKTFLSKLKFRTLITIVIMIILSKVFNLIFWDNLDEISSLNTGISIIGAIFITVVMLWISGWLVDNKTDF